MYVLSNHCLVFDPEDEGNIIAEEFKAAGHTKYLQYEVMQKKKSAVDCCREIVLIWQSFFCHCLSFAI